MRINDNIMALNAYRNLSRTEGNMSKSLEKLSSGYRINRAADDAAGLVISGASVAQVSGLQQGTPQRPGRHQRRPDRQKVRSTRSTSCSTACVTSRSKPPTARSTPTPARRRTTRSPSSRAEISRVGAQTKFGTQALLDGTYGNQAATITAPRSSAPPATSRRLGWYRRYGHGRRRRHHELQRCDHRRVLRLGRVLPDAAADRLHAVATLSAAVTVTVKDLGNNAFRVDITRTTAATGSSLKRHRSADRPGSRHRRGTSGQVSGQGGVFQIGANANETISVSIGSISNVGGTGLADVSGDVTTTVNAELFISASTRPSRTSPDWRGQLGAKQNRLESSVASLQVASENLTASNSQIRDTDMAHGDDQLHQDQILMQAGTAMLGQANKIPQSVLSLLQGQ